MKFVRRRLSRLVEGLADFVPAGEVVDGGGDTGEGIPGAVVWWRVRHQLTLLARGGA
ncbi:MAG: hypothetical protein GWM90_08470, partial [Gemmatimonadetes bacterium]|nr:hypothetical protein [Gemmatimonadota bacterium]NIU74082.1 hypothetical protein [Gammaproteobacteria bacterium]NIX42285.1 hypothetical protein [Gemmatimonadota bacterium]NIX44144.1 hypothetical protein [Gemmatimonadota bacterium]